MKKTIIQAVLIVILSTAVNASAGVMEAGCAFEKGDYAAAYREYRQAAGEGDALAHFALGFMFMQGLGVSRDYSRALGHLEKAVELEPRQGFYHNGLARLLATCPQAQYRDGKRAIAGALKALELDDTYPELYLTTLAAAYAESGDFALAFKVQQNAIDMLTAGGKKVDDAFYMQLESFKAKKAWRE